MKKVIRLTESDLSRLVKKIMIEQESFANSNLDEYMMTLDYIAGHFDNETTKEEMDFLVNNIEYEVGNIINDDELSDEERDELISHADFLIDDMISQFHINPNNY